MDCTALVLYDPRQVAVGSTEILQVVRDATTDDEEPKTFVCCRLTAYGNEILERYCHTTIQRRVWSFPTYEFWVRTINRIPAISVSQVS